ncbi:hypothetical protein [Mycolicibacterium fortuitum]|uniref:hypothetical protein n=1 Tax=Mycolicibacterium fortuitum TaxID=1766 RepID=UPI002629B262|nr:hypothetical protein [Mycolicibacterium fortuitum]
MGKQAAMIVRLILAPDENVTDAAARTRQLAEDLGVAHDFVDVVRTFGLEHYENEMARVSPAAAEQWSDKH